MTRQNEHMAWERVLYSHVVRIASKRTNIFLVKEFLAEVRRHVRIKEELYGNILIALTEAVNNGIIHGNMNDESKFVEVLCESYDDRIEFTVRDEGGGFNPESLPDPCAEENLLKEGGRGVHIIRSLMNNVTFSYNGHGMEIHFTADRERKQK